MKKTILLYLSLVLVFLMSGTLHASLLQNGGFDTDLSGWEKNGPVSWFDGKAHVGRPGADDDSLFWQYFDIDPKTTALNISFDYLWAGNGNTTVDDDFVVAFSYQDSSDQWNSIQLLNESNNDSVLPALSTIYYDQTVFLSSLSQNSSNGLIQFSLTEQYSSESQGTRIELDNVDISAVPEPTAILLFGIGLLGISGISRKKY